MSFLQSIPSTETSSVQVAVRIRPINKREEHSEIITNIKNNNILITNPDDQKKKTFSYDYVYNMDANQEQVYNDIGERVIDNAFRGYNSCIFAYGQTGCFAKDTPIMLISGMYKAVQDITLQDIIMGDDSTPRKVLRTFNGMQNMYRVKPPLVGDLSGGLVGHREYVVNEDHIMVFQISSSVECNWVDNYWLIKWFDICTGVNKSVYIKPNTNSTVDIDESKKLAEKFILNTKLRNTTRIIEMSIKDYLKIPKENLKYYSCFTTGIDFPSVEVELSPYFLGLWLADRKYDNLTDEEIIKYLQNGLDKQSSITAEHVSDHHNTNNSNNTNSNNNNRNKKVKCILGKYHIKYNKFIPNDYKYNSREVRLQILAGIIDINGHYKKNTNTYEVILKNKRLMDDTVYVARSLGYYVSYDCIKNIDEDKNCDVQYICYINGNVYEIPTLLNNKPVQVANPTNTTNLSNTTNTFIPIVECIGIGEYYGFMLDGNHRFIGAGFNVLRNSGKSYAMMGDTNTNPGLIPRICEALFERQAMHNNLAQGDCDISYRVEMSYLEIYSEEVRDLMRKDDVKGGLKVRQHPEYGPYVEGLTQLVVEDYRSIKRLIDQGNKERSVAATLMNARSSRSHAILTIYFTQIVQEKDIDKAREVVSKLNLVDLAGSERLDPDHRALLDHLYKCDVNGLNQHPYGLNE